MASVLTKTITVNTIGYQGMTVEGFIRHLKKEGVNMVVDVRAVPWSRKPGFNKAKLSIALSLEGIEYRHFPELGIPSALRKQIDNYSELFKIYEESILPKVTDSVEQVLALCEDHNIALMCFEEKPVECHRSRLSAYMAKCYGVKRHHIFR